MGYLSGPGPSNAIPPGEDHIVRNIRDIERFVRELSAVVGRIGAGNIVGTMLAAGAVTAPALGAGSVTAPALGVGSVTATAIGTGAVTAPALGVGSVTAPALGAGSVTFAALAAPTLPAVVNLTTTAFAPVATWAEVVGLDLTVPADCTRLLVTATAWIYAVNNSAAVDNLNARVSLAAVDGQAFLTPLPVAGFNTISAGLGVLAAGLTPGATVRLKASAKTTTGTWTTDAANTATLVASLTWLR